LNKKTEINGNTSSESKFDEAYLQNLIDKAKDTWKGVDADQWLSDLRGGYEDQITGDQDVNVNKSRLSDLNKKAYLFDLFHTLTGRESKWANLPTTSEFLGIDKKVWNDLLFNGSYDRLCGREKDEFRIIRTLVDKVKPDISDEMVREAVKIRKERFGQALINIPNESVVTLETLKKRGKKLGLVSNVDVMEIALWEKSPIAHFFDSTVKSCYAGCAKPDADIYEISMSELGVRSDEAVFIGDGGSDELAGAKKVGLTTVMITGIIQELWPEKIPDRRKWADYEIVNITELM
jgi:putative hydrolase of the HAD superfamily